MVHSSLKSFGRVEGGAGAVIDAFPDALGEEGTLVMPTLCRKDKERRFETWNIRTSPSDVGLITETFRLRPGVLRSDHATHSVGALGPLARRITAGHAEARGRPGPWGEAAFARGSPWQALYDLDAAVVLVGVDFKVNTLVHFIEHLMAERALGRSPREHRPALLERLEGWQKPGIWPGYNRLQLQEALQDLGAVSQVQCGGSLLTRVGAREMVDHALAWMETSPEAWFSAEVCEWLRACA
ncbi:MAG: AAC(3) family N-acetyltransferase [Planctomycetota bacterium]